MKKILFFILLILSINSYSYEFSISSFTLHHLHKNKNFVNKLTKNGEIIYNPLFSIGYKDFLMIGKDSANTNILGYYHQFNNNLIFGAYTHNSKKWDLKGLTLKHIQIHKEMGIMPIIGYKHSINLNKDIKLNIIITPIITNFSLSFNF